MGSVLCLAVGADAPVDDFRFINDEAVVLGRLKAGARSSGTVNIQDRMALAADQMVMIVCHPSFVEGWPSGRLYPPDEVCLDESVQIIVDSLTTERREPCASGRDNELRVSVLALLLHRFQHRDPGRSDAESRPLQEVLPATAHGMNATLSFLDFVQILRSVRTKDFHIARTESLPSSWLLAPMSLVFASVLSLTLTAQSVTVSSVQELIASARSAKPGTMILIRPGDYQGGILLENLHGAPGRPIIIKGADPKNPPNFRGGGSALQFSRVSHLEISDIKIEGARGNGLNIDDGGDYGKPSHHVTLKRVSVSDLPKGNNDGIKLSGLDDFRVEDCQVSRWGGSGIDMVGCHRGLILNCSFSQGGDSGIQAKGGSSEVAIRRCRFTDFGLRGVNIGGSTGREFFRPPLSQVRQGERVESRQITVEGCVFIKGGAPAAFVGTNASIFRFNTIINPGRFALRILQETAADDFRPCSDGVFSDNLIVFRSDNWGSGGVNIGPGTQPETFTFARNWWFCQDSPTRSRPTLPSAETGGFFGVDPKVDESGSPKPGSPAAKVGAHAFVVR